MGNIQAMSTIKLLLLLLWFDVVVVLLILVLCFIVVDLVNVLIYNEGDIVKIRA